MPNPDSIALAAAAGRDGLESLLVGGNAINLLAYSRTTFDVDLPVRESDLERWLSFFARHGYAIVHRTANFVRLSFAADSAAALPVDLMLADEQTFGKMRTESRSCDLGNDLRLTIPSPLHLVAIETPRPAESRPPGQWHRPAGCETFDQMRNVMPQRRSEANCSKSSGENRVREDAAEMVLPPVRHPPCRGQAEQCGSILAEPAARPCSFAAATRRDPAT